MNDRLPFGTQLPVRTSAPTRASTSVVPAYAAATLLALSACTADSVTAPPMQQQQPPQSTGVVNAEAVGDLRIAEISDSSLTVTWTEVEDGMGEPASYRLKYGSPPFEWTQGQIGCTPAIEGTAVGSPRDCTIAGLDPETAYDLQIMSYRVASGTWEGAVYSNVVQGATVEAGLAPAGTVSDLRVAATTESSATVTWTAVDDGTGNPALYRVKHAPPTISWSTATTACSTVSGVAIGATASCTITGLQASTPIEAQVMAYRTVDGAWVGATRSNVATGATSDSPAPQALSQVGDLTVTAVTDSSLTVSWTQIGDGTGGPASYRVKYAPPAISYGSATTACSMVAGTAIGASASCTVTTLTPSTDYEIQLMSFGLDNGAWINAQTSNVAAGRTGSQPASTGIWIGPAEIAALPMSGPAWTNLLAAADQSCGVVDLLDQDQQNDVCVLAKALVFARTGQSAYTTEVLAALGEVVAGVAFNGTALALGRELAAYVIAADVIGLSTLDPALDTAFRGAIRALLTTTTILGPSSLVDCHERRPNNWGTHCGSSRAAVAAYLGDYAELARVAQVFKGWLGDRSSYAGFSYGDLTWQCDPTKPVGINPMGCTRDGNSIDGVLADDQRRAGSYAWPPTKENYVWEALQGALVQAMILERAGYPAFQWENQALRRAGKWLNYTIDYPAEGDDSWQPYVLNHYYGTNFPTQSPARPGKNVGWTDWTHGS